MMRSNSSSPMQPLASHMVLLAVRLTKSESDKWIGGLKSCLLKQDRVTAGSSSSGQTRAWLVTGSNKSEESQGQKGRDQLLEGLTELLAAEPPRPVPVQCLHQPIPTQLRVFPPTDPCNVCDHSHGVELDGEPAFSQTTLSCIFVHP